MARLPNSPMTRAEFEQALSDAQQGTLTTDIGATEAVLAALERVAAAAPDCSAALIQATRDAFERGRWRTGRPDVDAVR